MKFRFFIRYLAVDPTGYYYPDWSKSTPIQIVAENKREADDKLIAVIGDAPDYKKWNRVIDSIIEEAE